MKIYEGIFNYSSEIQIINILLFCLLKSIKGWITVRILLFYLSVICLCSSLLLTKQFNLYGNYLIAASIIVIFPLILIRKNSIYKVNVLTISIMYGFVIVSCISALVNHDMMLMFTSIVMFLLCISSLVIVPSFEYININKLITKAILFTHVPLVVIPLLLYGLNTLPYRGIFYNLILLVRYWLLCLPCS